jgi:hypothetical protein
LGSKYQLHFRRKPRRKTSPARHRETRRLILEWNFKNVGRERVDWINLAQDMVQWRAVVNTEMNFRGP